MTGKTRWGEAVGVLHPNPALLKLAVLVAENLKDCPTCGDRRAVAGLTVKCRDWHEVCRAATDTTNRKLPAVVGASTRRK